MLAEELDLPLRSQKKRRPPAVPATMADRKLRATPTQLSDVLGACTGLNVVYRRLLKMTRAELQSLEHVQTASWWLRNSS